MTKGPLTPGAYGKAPKWREQMQAEADKQEAAKAKSGKAGLEAGLAATLNSGSSTIVS